MTIQFQIMYHLWIMLSKPQEEHLKSPPWNINASQVDGQQVEDRSVQMVQMRVRGQILMHNLDGNPSTFVVIVIRKKDSLKIED